MFRNAVLGSIMSKDQFLVEKLDFIIFHVLQQGARSSYQLILVQVQSRSVKDFNNAVRHERSQFVGTAMFDMQGPSNLLFNQKKIYL